MEHHLGTLNTPLGKLFCLIENNCISLLHPSPHLVPNSLYINSSHPLLAETQNQLDAYFSKKLQTFNLPLKITSSSFGEKILSALQEIPYGQTLSYKELASHIGHPKSYRALGSVLSKNPILLLISCHRIILSSGDLGQYLWGNERKKKLLTLEGAIFS
ncbi:methylated-DNA--[protein]-cysteine S-methyltransferase [Helicobacter kayseriensis]|uniref:methylated-DNA--[protein]-cysteine S-methyltransferase n=1 Tax=Helicobacter kayseriensis TaxID=2905877 RepID=UPI001E45EB9D|nr:methylated-DNA--[protein]-cysteine S-methyltransferase [Helicobacter kayseriensis]MCE3047211.1 methylated-DNA--[protein]-cysteine S-methyltransferase [Helicobacter kayseriensis]MCE3048582.1 methylated-DNA--[protein]-cysteine S-methyltransferase [Helicobacter kayseriensis]